MIESTRILRVGLHKILSHVLSFQTIVRSLWIAMEVPEGKNLIIWKTVIADSEHV